MQLALGTLASGVGSANMNRLLSFLNLQNARFLNKRFIRNMKSSIGSNLRKVATDSMKEAIEEKFRFRLAINDGKNSTNTNRISKTKTKLVYWYNRVFRHGME